MHFDSATGRLQCDYCGSSYEVSEIEALYADKNATAADAAAKAEEKRASANRKDGGVDGWQLEDTGTEWNDSESGVKAYNCPSCGAELICDDTTAATSCPYCDNPTIIPSSLSGSLKPDAIVPFKLDKEQAKKAFRSHLKGKRLLRGSSPRRTISTR